MKVYGAVCNLAKNILIKMQQIGMLMQALQKAQTTKRFDTQDGTENQNVQTSPIHLGRTFVDFTDENIHQLSQILQSCINEGQVQEQRKNRSYTFPTWDTFNIDEFLSPKIFPHTYEDGKLFVEEAIDTFNEGLQALIEMPELDWTFDSVVLQYHDLLTQFDAKERLIRSERLIVDETPGKQELLDRCTAIKNEAFSNLPLLSVFIAYAGKENDLSPLQKECLKGVINSIQEDVLPLALLEPLQQIKQKFAKNETVAFAYLRGDINSKVIDPSNKAFTYLTSNLCLMPETSSMIYGGLLPWPLRIDAIVEKIKQLDADILFLQEVYDVRAIFELHKRLQDTYAHFYGNITPRLCGFSHTSLYSSSGLAIISKFKLENVRFEPYTVITSDEKIPGYEHVPGYERLLSFGFDRNYGVLHCDVLNGNDILAHFATSHENPFFANVREKQTAQIVGSIASKAKSYSRYPFILAGDLNIERGDLKEGAERLIKEHFIDPYSGGYTWNDFNDYWHKWLRDVKKFIEAKHTPWTCDRSLLWSDWAQQNHYSMKTERIIMCDREDPEKALSDHHAILTSFAY